MTDKEYEEAWKLIQWYYRYRENQTYTLIFMAIAVAFWYMV